MMRAAALALLCATLSVAQVTPPRPGTLTKTCGEPGTFALTYDDGPYLYTGELVDVLNAANVSGTLFVCGRNYVDIYDPKYQAFVRKAYDAGHYIGSHTWSHQDLTNLTEAEVRFQVTELDKALRSIIGVAPTYLRPPFGATNSLVLNILAELGYRAVTWNVDVQDYNHPDDVQADLQAIKNALNGADPTKDTFIALEHEVYPVTVNPFTAQAIALIQAAKFKVTSVPKCFNDPTPYKP